MEFINATKEDHSTVAAIENECFPPDEAASSETVLFRLQNASEYFRVAKVSGNIIAFINGTSTTLGHIRPDDMKGHQSEGAFLVIHSVSVSPAFQRRGIARALLTDYLYYIADKCPIIKEVLLLSKASLLGFYSSCGFDRVRVSEVSHGKVNRLV